MRVEKLQEEYGVRVEWRPFELHPEIPPEGIPMTELLRRGRFRSEYYEHLRWVAAEAGIAMVQPGIIPNTSLSLQAAEFARENGGFDAYHRCLFAAHFERGENIGDAQVLQDLAEASDLDGKALRAALSAGVYREVVEESTGQARERGVGGTPTFMFGDRLELVGAQEYRVFADIVERLGAKKKS